MLSFDVHIPLSADRTPMGLGARVFDGRLEDRGRRIDGRRDRHVSVGHHNHLLRTSDEQGQRARDREGEQRTA